MQGLPDGIQIPPEIAGAVGASGFLGGAWLAWRFISEAVKLRSETGKSDQQRKTAELLGDKAESEARKAGVETLAAIVANLRAEIKANHDELEELKDELAETRGALETERQVFYELRTALLEFIGTVETLMPSVPDEPRGILQAALQKLRTVSAWHWPLTQLSHTRKTGSGAA